MLIRARLALSALVPLLCGGGAAAQQDSATTPAEGEKITLDVVVTSKSGPPVTGLQQQDFTLLDNKVARPITSFQALGRSRAPVEVIVVVDAVNTGIEQVSYEREEIEKFLRTDGGHLAYPTTIAVFTDNGIQKLGDLTDDGNALSALLDHSNTSLRYIGRSAGFYGATDRFYLSLKALNELTASAASLPGRKVILWVSPGWPLLSGPNVELDYKQEQGLFENIVAMSTQLRKTRTTLYSVDPLGSADFGGRTFYYQEFLKGISKPSQVNAGDLALQVLAVQSGGLALTASNDIALLLQKCMADTDVYYEMTFDSPASGDKDEYHHLEIEVDKAGLTARTRQGYYVPSGEKKMKEVPILENPVKH